MKLFVIFGIIFAWKLPRINAEYAVGVQMPSLASGDELICTKSGFECSTDCSTIMYCANVSTPPLSIACPYPTRWCSNNGACTTRPSAQCVLPFKCTRDGIYPDPSDCTKYRVCQGEERIVIQCPSGFTFNSRLSVCEKGILPCTKIDCSNVTESTIIVYESDPRYYLLCAVFDEIVEPYMYKCDEGIFDRTYYGCRCQFNCY